MRTTVTIRDELLKAAKREARRRGLSLGRLIDDALRRELTRRTDRRPGPPVPVFRGAGGVRPGVDPASNRALLEALDEGEPPDRRR
jgi:hypothetical protein